MTGEMKILVYIAAVFAGINLLAMLLFVLFAKLPNGRWKEIIRNIIFELDKFADSMANSEKRAEAIRQINSILSWRSIMIPSVLIGWVIDTEVAAIRKMQKATNTPDLHEDETVVTDKNNSGEGGK